MNRLSHLVLPHLALLPLLALSLALAGCDSDEDDRTAEERLRGAWQATAVSVTVENPVPVPGVPTFALPIFAAGDEGAISLSFETGNAFAFTVEGPLEASATGVGTFPLLSDGEGLTNAGRYEVVGEEGPIVFTVNQTDGQPVPATNLEVAFDFRGDDAFVFTLDNSEEGRAALAFLLGDAFPQEVFDAIEGGEARFERVTRTNP